MQTVTKNLTDQLQDTLDKRKSESLYRSLLVNEGLADFCSNDYLSFARTPAISSPTEFPPGKINGATGSRSISGNSRLAEDLEREIAAFHGAEAGLLFNSGYDANLGLFSCLPSRGDTIITDELIHASIIDGCRLSYANRLRFRHNDPEDLEGKLKKATGNVFVAVESVYSMDGDSAPLNEFANLCEKYNAHLIVDEAHATGVFGNNGRGLVSQAGLENKVFARVHTFGKALGCHGAIVTGNSVLRNYLINFARSFIFTTALPPASLLQIRAAYQRLNHPDFSNEKLHGLIDCFRKNFIPAGDAWLINSTSPVQSVVTGGNKRTRRIAAELQQRGFDIRAIVSPSVPAGKERLRISLHLHNSAEEVKTLLTALTEILAST